MCPAVRRHVDDGDDLADKEIAEHAEVERMLKERESCEPGETRFATLATQLKESVTSHVRDGENRLFPLLADACSAENLGELGEMIRSAMKTAPTCPHPSAPDIPPANKLVAHGTGMVDRVRDMLTGRGHLG